MKRKKYLIELCYNWYTIADWWDVEDDFLDHYKQYIKSKDTTARFRETGSGSIISGKNAGDRDITYMLSSERVWYFKELFRNMRRYLYRRGFPKASTKITIFENEEN